MKLTLDQFISSLDNTTPKHPKGIDGQCVALIRRYLDDVLGFPQFRTIKGAVNMWEVFGVMADTDTESADYTRIPNRWWTIPKKGDIFVTAGSKRDGYNGHNGIVLTAGLFGFTSFDANWSVRNIANIERHNYTNPKVLGFFRPNVEYRATLDRVNEALRECGDDPARSVGTLNVSRWWQNRVARNPSKFSNDERGYEALVNAIKWNQGRKKYPHDN